MTNTQQENTKKVKSVNRNSDVVIDTVNNVVSLVGSNITIGSEVMTGDGKYFNGIGYDDSQGTQIKKKLGRPVKYHTKQEYYRACNRSTKFKYISQEEAVLQIAKYKVLINELEEFLTQQ